MSHSLNFVKDGAHLDTLKIQQILNSFYLQNFKFQFFCVTTLKLWNCVIRTLLHHYACFHDFKSMFITLIEWKKRKERKIYDKKTACKTAKGGKTNGFDSWGRPDTWFDSWTAAQRRRGLLAVGRRRIWALGAGRSGEGALRARDREGVSRGRGRKIASLLGCATRVMRWRKSPLTLSSRFVEKPRPK